MAQDREAWQEFARLQRQYRMEQGLSQERLAEKVAYSESAVGHVERLMRKPTEHYTREIEKALGLDGQLMRLVPPIHGNMMGPRWFREWPKVEALAHTIRIWEPMLVPGLLQTESYARQVFLGEPGAIEEEAQKAIRFRLHRQAVFAQSRPPLYSALIDESVLHRPVGGREVMREQLGKILEVLNPPYITVRIVPLAAGLTIGCLGAFEVATLQEGGPDHAYLESAEEGRVTNRATTAQTLMVRWEALSSMANPVDKSRETIREVMLSYG
ncbi:helix-turn-helix transcriptional regulator [Nonomuraea sp. C10]|uniref:helix-turn-helix domain-containing protein n=1 Tax=Nonomuraea sp. C10 TaxID=2600577 RepID=UPI0011CE0270|nr:helix-turn-helix transcriptional regulator [Nonomuraea sp. C10]TXK38265.1 helix-turn-helix transcriptional regulator [Nonomuraea sp. C10]